MKGTEADVKIPGANVKNGRPEASEMSRSYCQDQEQMLRAGKCKSKSKCIYQGQMK